MKRIFLSLTSLLVALVLPGCLQSETTVHLNKDGSGTLVEQTTFGQQMSAMFAQMSAMGGEFGADKDPLAAMFSEEKAKARAKSLGEGVTFEKSEPVSNAGAKGARVSYRFADINKLKLAPGEGMKDLSPAGGEAPDSPKAKPIGFNYAGGKLTVTMPDQEKPEVPAGAEAAKQEMEQNPEMESMMKQMLGDMKVSIKLVVEPGIAETDATYRDGKTVTLMEMEMGKVLEKPDAFKKLQNADQNDPTAAMEALKGLDGVKMETKKVVTVKVN